MPNLEVSSVYSVRFSLSGITSLNCFCAKISLPTIMFSTVDLVGIFSHFLPTRLRTHSITFLTFCELTFNVKSVYIQSSKLYTFLHCCHRNEICFIKHVSQPVSFFFLISQCLILGLQYVLRIIQDHILAFICSSSTRDLLCHYFLFIFQLVYFL